MPNRSDHTFQFTAEQIAKAATAKAKFHHEREGYWLDEQRAATAVVRETATVKVAELPITGGHRVDVVVDYGDPAAYRRMQEAFTKWQSHRDDALEFESDARLYGSQEPTRVYEMSADDAFHYGLA